MIARCCPACGGEDLIEIYRLDSIPVQSCVLLPTREEALDFAQAPLALQFCDGCGFIFNALFRPDLVDYASITEESQHFSNTFNAFALRLVEEIARCHDLAGRWTVEIGCGKGDFLRELAVRTGTRGLGIDPGFLPERFHRAEGSVDVRFRREYFDPASVEVSPHLIVCRHTLEHVPDVRRFVAGVSSLAGGRDEVGIFFETPDAERLLAEGAFWDIYYEHCSYFTLGSHARLFHRHAMEVTRSYLDYGDQYIIQHARPGRHVPRQDGSDLPGLRDLARAFPARVASVRARWTDFVCDRHRAGRRIAIWGGGSKAVSFLTTNGLGGEVAQVVDINPYKQGKYLPGTGHRIMRPEDLAHAPPDTVIVMNPLYVPEVAATLERLGLSPELTSV